MGRECCVCLLNFNYSSVRLFYCNHFVCKKCLINIIDHNYTNCNIKCPLCRSDIVFLYPIYSNNRTHIDNVYYFSYYVNCCLVFLAFVILFLFLVLDFKL